ncbi:MAG: GNAT family N-acetyltransferase [Burkholderiales bacterium]|nr:GNAT family N-acetyltransferase [Burkholderiales bacterium]
MIRIERYDNPAQFAADCRDFVMQDLRARDRSYVLINNVATAAEVGHKRLYRIVENGKTEGVALIVTRAPIRRLMLDVTDARYVPELIAALQTDGEAVTAVMGNAAVAKPFADQWGHHRTHMQMGSLALTSGPHHPAAAGCVRPATAADTDRLHTWLAAFIVECRLNEDPSRLPQDIKDRLAAPEPVYWLWEVDGEPVSLSRCSGDTNVTRIGAVYTPPEARGRGYAGTLVAELCTRLRSRGVREICLSTDLTNPTSNALYKRIGFEQIGEAVELVFA